MGIWSQASKLAAATPESRNRYVDFLRAVSILMVISGHWLITTAVYDPGERSLTPVLALDVVPWSAWLTWVFQVMPIFFIVGGYSNAVSLESAARKNLGYAEWLAGRLHRLLMPLLLLVLAWAGIAIAMRLGGVGEEAIRFFSKAALVPTWFLAIYTMIVLLAPATYALWRRWGFASLFLYLALAVAVDAAFFLLDWRALGASNYFWVWLAMHHLGFVWRDGRQGQPWALLLLAAAALATLALLILPGPYPIAMAGSPGEDISNTLPPKVTLAALGLFQFGLLLAMEKPMQRLLSGLRMWTGTVIINTMIMTVYLWHMTVLLLVLAVAYWLGGFGLMLEVGSPAWWWSRILWLALLGVLLIPFALLLSPLERQGPPKGKPAPPAWRLVAGAVMAGAGITLATLWGFDGRLLTPATGGIVALILAGALTAGVRPQLPGRSKTRS